MAQQDGAARFPVQVVEVQELSSFLGDFRQYWCQVGDQLAEQVDGNGTDFDDFLLAAFFLVHRPRGFFLNVFVGAVGEGHDFFHGFAEFTGFVVCRDAITGVDKVLHHGFFNTGVAQFATGFLDEVSSTAGDVNQFVDQIGVGALDEVFEVKIEVVDAGT